MKPPLTYRKIVFVVTYRINSATGKIEYLILHRKKHWVGWEFPKGGVDAGESLWQTTKREILEESGLRPFNIRKYKHQGKYKYPHGFPDRKGIIGQSYTLFSVQVGFGKVRIDGKEHSEYVWLDFNKAIKQLKHDDQKKCLRIVNGLLEKREH